MEITSINPAVKNPNRVNIFVDRQFSFSLDLTQLVDEKLKVGQRLSDSDLARLKDLSSFGKLYQRSLEWVLSRPRSVKETRDYLKRKQIKKPEYAITNAAITAIIERLQAHKYLDDARFTAYYLENRHQKKGISRRQLEQELRQKYGISPSLIQSAIIDSPRSDAEEITKLIRKKRRLKSYDDVKLTRYLLQKGFDYDLVKAAVSRSPETD